MAAEKKKPVVTGKDMPVIETAACFVCNSVIETTPRMRGADFILCVVHSAVLHDTVPEQHRLRALRELINRAEVEDSIDHPVGVRYFKHIAPKPRKPQPISYDDDGTPRYRDMSTPHGLTFRPGIDIVQGGGDPRLNAYREPEPAADADDEPLGYRFIAKEDS
jgi:hypothetical protein